MFDNIFYENSKVQQDNIEKGVINSRNSRNLLKYLNINYIQVLGFGDSISVKLDFNQLVSLLQDVRELSKIQRLLKLRCFL